MQKHSNWIRFLTPNLEYKFGVIKEFFKEIVKDLFLGIPVM